MKFNEFGVSLFKNNRESTVVLVLIMVLMMIIIPLPTYLMDSIIAFNLGVSVLILMVVFYIKSSLAISTFPSILLILALIRIGITISTSRLILLNGDAGEIVSTFGDFVVNGNLVVGGIIFLVITLINFIVITKGSERVAEVAARFSLDAMPGKQMTIDGDLKAGNITMEQATILRQNLSRESRLYGAMDGAMKFVKGDAIASIIDILINICGGLIIGIAMQGLSAGAAAEKYSILTIGDGLVQQIPALLISITSGILITHVTDDESSTNLGQIILKQLFSDYKPVFAAAALLFGLIMIPGMPSLILSLFLIMFLFIGFILYKKHERSNGGDNKQMLVEDADNDGVINPEVQMKISPLTLHVSNEMRTQKGKLNSALNQIYQEFAKDLGVSIPQIILRYNHTFKISEYQLDVFELPEVKGNIYWDKILVLDNEAKELINFENMIDNQLETGLIGNSFWVDARYLHECKSCNITVLNIEEFLILHLKFYIKTHITGFFGLQEVKNLLDKFTEYQELIRELLRMLPLNKITEIFQLLISEGISIRNLKLILDTMLEWAQEERNVIIIGEQIRQKLGRYIAHKFSHGSYMFSSIILDYQVEDLIRDNIRYTEQGSHLNLDTKHQAAILRQIYQITRDNPLVKNPTIICQADIRRYVRTMIEIEIPNLVVLSFQELGRHAKFNSLGKIELN